MTIKEIKEAAQSPTPEWFYKRLLIIYASLFGVFLTICGFMLNGYQTHIEDTFKEINVWQKEVTQRTIQNSEQIKNIEENYAQKVWVMEKLESRP